MREAGDVGFAGAGHGDGHGSFGAAAAEEGHVFRRAVIAAKLDQECIAAAGRACAVQRRKVARSRLADRIGVAAVVDRQAVERVVPAAAGYRLEPQGRIDDQRPRAVIAADPEGHLACAAQFIAAGDRHALAVGLLVERRRRVPDVAAGDAAHQVACLVDRQPFGAGKAHQDLGRLRPRGDHEVVGRSTAAAADHHVDPGIEVAIDGPAIGRNIGTPFRAVIAEMVMNDRRAPVFAFDARRARLADEVDAQHRLILLRRRGRRERRGRLGAGRLGRHGDDQPRFGKEKVVAGTTADEPRPAIHLTHIGFEQQRQAGGPGARSSRRHPGRPDHRCRQ